MAKSRQQDPKLEKHPTFDWLPTPSARTLSLPEQIAEKVGNAIIKGLFEPGQRIQEQELADRFEVSRGPVREALRILEKDGMVQILPRRGAQVTRLNIEEVNEIFEIRSSLFGLAAKLFAIRPDPAALQQLKEGVDRLQLLGRGDQADEYVSAVYRLNMTVAESSGNRHLRNMMFSLAHQTLRYSRLGLSTEKRRQQSAKNWRRLCTALLHKDPAAAQEAAELLVTESRDMAVRLLREEEERSRGQVHRAPAA
jgi:DNA-binding GntR family transcriptional regulator